MNILFVVPYDYEKIGGLYLPLNNYKKNLELRGHKTVILGLPYHIRRNDRKKLNQHINQIIENQFIDCVIGFTLNQSYMIAKQLHIKKTNIRKIGFLMDCMRLHSISILKKQFLNFKNILRLFVYTYKERVCLRFFSDIIYVSNVDIEYVNHYYKSKSNVVYIPNGATCHFIKEYNKLKELRIGCLTGFSKDTLFENLYPLIHNIYPHIREHFPEIRLVIAGRNAPIEVENELKKEPGITYLGFVENLESFYDSVDIVVTTVQKECGILNRILEAWSFGKVVVGYQKNFKTFTDAKNGIHYITADSPDDFIKAIQKIKKNISLLASIGIAAHKLVKESYSWEKSTNILESLILKENDERC